MKPQHRLPIASPDELIADGVHYRELLFDEALTRFARAVDESHALLTNGTSASKATLAAQKRLNIEIDAARRAFSECGDRYIAAVRRLQAIKRIRKSGGQARSQQLREQRAMQRMAIAELRADNPRLSEEAAVRSFLEKTDPSAWHAATVREKHTMVGNLTRALRRARNSKNTGH
jgi:hypothetical protein